MAMKPHAKHHTPHPVRRRRPVEAPRSLAKAAAKNAASDPVDDTTTAANGAPRRGHCKPDNTAAIWCFIGGLFCSMAAIAAGVMGGWLLLVLTLSMGYAWMPRRPVQPAPRVQPKPTQVTPRMQRLLTEPKGMAVLGSALLGAMVLVGWLANG
jgi:hypothetical protein